MDWGLGFGYSASVTRTHTIKVFEGNPSYCSDSPSTAIPQPLLKLLTPMYQEAQPPRFFFAGSSLQPGKAWHGTHHKDLTRCKGELNLPP